MNEARRSLVQPVALLARAAVSGTLAALVANAALQLALSTAQMASYRTASWWQIAELPERGVAVIAAALCVWAALPIASLITGPVSQPVSTVGSPVSRVSAVDVRQEKPWTLSWRLSLRIVGVTMIALPLASTMASWVVIATRLAVARSWSTEGLMFLSGYYYYLLMLAIVPWLLGGAVLLAWSRHVEH